MSDWEFAQALTEAVDTARFRFRRTVLGGKRVTATTVTLLGAPEGKSWVRGFDESREETPVWGTVNAINAAVEIDLRIDGDYEIVGINYPQAVATHGAAALSVTQPRGLDEVVPRSIPALGLTEGRLEVSDDGGLSVHSNAFTYDGGYHAGGFLDGAGNFDPTYYDESVSAYAPAVAGTAVWVRRYFDPSDTSFHFAAGTAEPQTSVLALDEADIAAIPIPAGAISVGAVALYYGQTGVTGGRFASARDFLKAHDTGGQWIVDYTSTIPAGVTAVIPRGVAIASTGSLTVDGGLYIV